MAKRSEPGIERRVTGGDHPPIPCRQYLAGMKAETGDPAVWLPYHLPCLAAVCRYLATYGTCCILDNRQVVLIRDLHDPGDIGSGFG